MLKNKDEHVRELAIIFREKYKVNEFMSILFIRRLNSLGYVVVKGEDLKKCGDINSSNIGKIITTWKDNFKGGRNND